MLEDYFHVLTIVLMKLMSQTDNVIFLLVHVNAGLNLEEMIAVFLSGLTMLHVLMIVQVTESAIYIKESVNVIKTGSPVIVQ